MSQKDDSLPPVLDAGVHALEETEWLERQAKSARELQKVRVWRGNLRSIRSLERRTTQ